MDRSRWLILLIVALIVGAAFVVSSQSPRLGLDLQGGTRLTLEARPTADVKEITEPVMDSLLFVIERRVNQMGIGETIVQRSGDDRLIVEIPGVQDPEAAKETLGRVGKLEFKELVTNKPKADANNAIASSQWRATGVSGKDLAKAAVGTDQAGNWLIEFELNANGTQRFAELTTRLAATRAPLGIFFDDQFISAPVVQSAILNGSGQISGQFTREEAQNLVDTLNAGALPVDVGVIEEATVGPLLGLASITKSLKAGLIGLALVMLFMAIYYRGKGIVANVALLIYTLLLYAVFVLFGMTFTLAGIAGIILSIGMAVDANILIFERTKEEQAMGKPPAKAVDAGFDRAFPSIFDSNMTTMITCLLLWWLGTGPVKGFAFTLGVGVLVSMFSAITVTRSILHLLGELRTAREAAL